MKKLLILLSVIALILTLCACGGECTVTFTCDGEVYHTATVAKGDSVTLPGAPEKEGYTFFGWLLDGEKFDGTAGISSDITLEAYFVDNATAAFGNDLEYELSDDGSFYAVAGIGGWKTKDVVIPATHLGLPVSEVLERAFFGLTDIMSISLPASVTSIGERAFSDCSALTSFNVAAENTAYAAFDGDLYSKDGTVLVQYAIGKSAVSLSIGEGVVKIGTGALSRSTLTSLSLPSTLLELGDYACYASQSLSSVTFADGAKLSTLGEGAFSSCTALTAVTLPSSVETLGDFAFYTCSSLIEVRFDKGSKLSAVGEYAFERCEKLSGISYDGSRYKWELLIEAADNNETLKDINFIGCPGSYEAPVGVWIPTAEYDGITYAAWSTEDDYLSGAAPVKWYSDTNISREGFGATDDNGTFYADPNFIPGYIHIFSDVTINTKQLVVGHEQKLILNLGGNTVTATKGFRVGGNYAYHPEASLTVKCGTLDLAAGQIQPRGGSTLVFENAVLRTSAVNVVYGAQSRLIHFKDSELIVTSGADFRLSTNFAGQGDGEMSIVFEDSDVIYTNKPKTSVFEFYESHIGSSKWKISFDKDSALIGAITEFVTLREGYVNETVESFVETQVLQLAEGVRFLNGAVLPTEYTIIEIDPETGEAKAAVRRPFNDALVVIQ